MPTHAEYAVINIACKELGLDKYQLLADRYGLTTSKDLSRRQTFDLLEYFRALGFRKKPGKKRQTSPRYTDPQKRKAVALWITLGREGVLKNRSDRALQKYVKRMTGKDNLKWCDGQDLNILIEGLKQWAAREGVELD